MPQFPAGTVTFLFTDIEQSTKGWERDAAVARVVVERHLVLIRQAVETHGGVHFKTVGDATQSAFGTAPRGVAAALNAQRALLSEPWPSEENRPCVRMALHAGTAEPRDGDYLAGCLNRLARLLDVAHGEQILLSSTVAELARDALPEAVTLAALGEYRLRDILQPEEIFQLRHPALRTHFPPLNTPGELPHNLPIHPTPFLGREREVEEITALLLRPGVRLVTLTGPGGVGKTRLGLRVAAEALESFPDGVFLVDLARQTDPGLIPSATATSLGLREQPGQTLQETLAGYLRERQILLLFDNFEHVLPAATFVADLLASTPGLKVLTTSRARLGLQAEREYRVEPLPVPDREALPPLAELSSYDAIELFTTRAQALRPGFMLTRQNAPAVAEIVCRLDGLPLAIELAAARVKLLSPEALLDRLDRRLSTLTGGARDLPTRQRTLRDTIAWSHDLLAPPEKMLFRRLSVFVGDWTLEAAEAVATVDASEPIDAFQGLATLIDQSLVDERPTPDAIADEPRYGMLETIREFASEQLAASGEIVSIERAFESFLISRAEAAEQGMKGPDQTLWLERLDAEHDNLRAALGRALDRGDGATALRLAPRLWEFWRTRGFPGEGRSWLERALAMADEDDLVGRAAAEFGLGHLSMLVGDLDGAQTHLEASLDLCQRNGDEQGVAAALSALAVVAINRYAYEDARALGERALRLRRKLGDRRGEATTLNHLAMAAREEGDLSRASALFEQSLAIWRERNEPAGMAWVTLALGITRRMAGDGRTAEALLGESLVLSQKLGDRFKLAVIALERGHLARQKGDHKAAAALYGTALRHFTDVGGNLGVVESLEWLAATAADQGAPVPALRLFRAAETARRSFDLPSPAASDASVLEAKIAQAEAAVGAEASRVSAEGRALSFAAATVEAFQLAQSLSTDGVVSAAG
jgi:predicted ATPase/class 3 adenylate cyclase